MGAFMVIDRSLMKEYMRVYLQLEKAFKNMGMELPEETIKNKNEVVKKYLAWKELHDEEQKWKEQNA